MPHFLFVINLAHRSPRDRFPLSLGQNRVVRGNTRRRPLTDGQPQVTTYRDVRVLRGGATHGGGTVMPSTSSRGTGAFMASARYWMSL